jgi:hypothetical protein
MPLHHNYCKEGIIVIIQFGPFAFNLILWGLKFKINRSGIYFDKKCDLSTCEKTKDYNVFLSFSSYH